MREAFTQEVLYLSLQHLYLSIGDNLLKGDNSQRRLQAASPENNSLNEQF